MRHRLIIRERERWGYPFHPRVTAVARKRFWPFCQKNMWQITAKHTCGFE